MDSFKPGQLIPCLQLIAGFARQEASPDPIPALFHPLSLNGAKEPNNVIIINIGPTMKTREQAQLRGLYVCLEGRLHLSS